MHFSTICSTKTAVSVRYELTSSIHLDANDDNVEWALFYYFDIMKKFRFATKGEFKHGFCNTIFPKGCNGLYNLSLLPSRVMTVTICLIQKINETLFVVLLKILKLKNDMILLTYLTSFILVSIDMHALEYNSHLTK